MPLDGGGFNFDEDGDDDASKVVNDDPDTKPIFPGPKLFLDGSQFMNPTKSDFCLAFMVPQFPDPSQQPAKKDVLLCTSVKSLIAHLVLKQVLLIICFVLIDVADRQRQQKLLCQNLLSWKPTPPQWSPSR